MNNDIARELKRMNDRIEDKDRAKAIKKAERDANIAFAAIMLMYFLLGFLLTSLTLGIL